MANLAWSISSEEKLNNKSKMAKNNAIFGFKSASGRGGYRNQAGGGDYWYTLGRQAAEAAFAQGGVNGLLAFLAGFNASDYGYGGAQDLLDTLN